MEQSQPRRPQVCFYGDDFTGAADNLAQYHREGLRALMFFDTPAPALLARYAAELDVIGIAGIARSLPAAQMDAEVRPALEAFRRLECRIVQYKICSTFDSAPDLGSFGQVLDVARELFGYAPVPVVAGCPDFGRYTVFGNHFAQFMGEVHRLDRHPTMSRHPATPMQEADLRRHLAAQTPLQFGLMNIVAMRAAEDVFRLQLALATKGGPGGVVFDVLDNQDLDRAAAVVWERSDSGAVFTLAAQGLASGLARHMARLGFGDRSTVVNSPLRPVDRLLVLSGSCSPQTGAQIRRARADGWVALPLDVPAALDTARAEPALQAVVAATHQALSAGRSVVVYTAEGPDDPAITATRDALRDLDLPSDALAPAIGRTYGQLLTRVMNRVQLERIVLAGGDTSSHTMRTLDAFALAIESSNFAVHSHVCRLLSENPSVAGTQVLLKGGQGGSDDLFLTVRSAQGWR